jgi:capsular exopolysaccharide synthesis family protein
MINYNQQSNQKDLFNQPLNNNDSIDFKRYLSLFLSNWYWFAVTLFIAFGFAYFKNRYSGKVYTVSSSLVINDDQFGGKASADNIFPISNAFKSIQNLNNEIGILKSFSLNSRVMKELPLFHVVYVGVGKRGIAETRLYTDTPFKVVYDSLEKQTIGLPITIKILSSESYKLEIDGNANFNKDLYFGERFNEMGFDFTIIPNTGLFFFDPDASNKYYFYFANLVDLANQYRSILNITPIEKEATLVTLSTSGFVREQEADYLNKLMDVYLKQGLEVKNQTAENTIEFINKQIGSISDSLKNAEGNLEDFRLSNKLIDLTAEGSLIQNRLERFENERIELNLQKKYYEYLKEYINTKNETGDIVSPGVMGMTNTSLDRLVQELTMLQQQRNKMELNISGDLPAVTLINNGIEDVKALIIENIRSNMSSLELAINETDSKIAAVEAEINKLPGTERSLLRIQRKFDINNTVYTYLLEKKAEAGIARASTVSDNRIVDNAESFNASQISPRSRENYTLALILGLLIPILSIILIDYLNNKIVDRKDIEKGTNVPVLGSINHSNYKSGIPVKEKPSSTLAESFRSIRTSLKYFIKENKNPVIVISSTISSEGKTFVSINLAAIIAMLGKRVLLIGLDLRKPRIHKILGVDNEKGMSNFLCGDINDYNEVIQSTEVENLFYASSGPVPPNPAELIETEKMKWFIETSKRQFDFVIIDTPPIALVTDALLLAPYVEMCLLIVRQRYSSRNTLNLIEELYKNGTFKNLGIVLNDVSLSGYYGYGLRYGYMMGYGYSYGYNYYGSYADSKYGHSHSSESYYKEE